MYKLVKSLRMFDPEKGYRVSTYVTIRPVGDDSIFSEATHIGDEVEYLDELNGHDETPDYDQEEILKEVFSHLDATEEWIIRTTMSDRYTNAQLGEVMGCSGEWVRSKRTALRKEQAEGIEMELFILGQPQYGLSYCYASVPAVEVGKHGLKTL